METPEDTMSVDTEIAIMIALVPFLAVWALLAFSSRVELARNVRMARQIALTEATHSEAGVGAPLASPSRVEPAGNVRMARQIALTEAIHRELGALAPPGGQRGWTGR